MQIAEPILKSLQQPVLVLDDALRPIFANPAFFRMFDLSPEDLEDRFILALIYGEICQPSLQEIIESTITNESNGGGIEAVCTSRMEKQIDLMVNVQRIHGDGFPELFLMELRNITKEKESESRIQELNGTLQKHVTTVDAINEELESYSHSVSHDLRTPLRFVSRIAHLLLHEPGTNLSKIAIQRVNMILQATTEMGRLIENLLVFSQVTREPITKRRMNLRSLFLEAAKELENEQDDRDVEIVIQDLIPCHGDRILMKEVASNLLANALKFTRQCEKATITIGCQEAVDGTIYFVQDNGIGFDIRKSDTLFHPFHKLHTTAEFEGTGIGLALVKRIIERHGGRIWAESEVDRGAIFFFTLGK